MTHPVYGILTKEEFEHLQTLPAGKAGMAIRRKDPLWGRINGEGEMSTFKVKVTATCTITQTDSNTFTVSAYNEEQAKEVAGALAGNYHWNNLDENPDDMDMEIVK